MLTRIIWSVALLCLSLPSFANHPKFQNFKLTDKFEAQTRSQQGLPPVLQKLWDRVKSEGYKLVNSAWEEIMDQRQDVQLGRVNFPELSWYTAIDGQIQVGAVRRLEPMLNQEGWIVLDRLVLGVGAKQYLSKLRDAGQVEISDEQLNAFAGIFYKREYSYQYFARTYEEGLKKNFDRLLLSFKSFDGNKFLDIENNELIQKEEFLSLKIGANARTPSIYGLQLMAGATVAFNKLSNISYHRLEQTRSAIDELRVSHKKMRVLGSRVEVALQLDFLNLLKISLLGGEYQNSHSRTKITHFTFNHQDLVTLPAHHPLMVNFDDFNNGKDPKHLEEFKPFEDGTQDSRVASENMALYLLMWGKLWGSSTEELILRSDQWERFFYRFQQERVAFDRSLLDTVFNSRNFSKYKTRDVENLVFEFEAPSKQPDMSQLPSDIRFSVRLSKEFSAKKDRSSDKRKLIDLMKSFTELEGGIITGIDNGKIKAPYSLDLNAQVAEGGIISMFNHSQYELNNIYAYICSGGVPQNMNQLTKQVKRCMSKFDQTYRALYVQYHYHQNFALTQFKAFMEHLGQNAQNFSGLKLLFGEDNVQLYGRFNGKTESEAGFNTFFKEGEFQGHGIIKDALMAR